MGLQPGDVLIEVNGAACASPGEVHAAWRAPRDGRVRFTYERDGELHEVDEPLPLDATVTVDPTPWRDHLATTADR